MPENTNNNVNAIQDIKDMLSNGFLQTFSDDYAVKIFLALPMIWNHLYADSTHTAASGLILSPLNALYIPLITPLFGRSHALGGWFHELKDPTTSDARKNELKIHIQATFKYGCIYLTSIAVPLVMMPMVFSKPLFLVLNQDKNVVEIASQFLQPFSNIVFPGYFSFFASQFLIANENKKTLQISMVILGLNLFLTYLFSFGKMGFSKKESDAVLLFFSLDTWARAFFYGYALFFQLDLKELDLLKSLFKSIENSTDNFLKFLRDGANPLITTLTEYGMMFSLTSISIRFGVNAQAIFALATQCLSMNGVFNLNFAVAGMVKFNKINSELSNENSNIRKRLYAITKNSMIISTLIASPLAILFMLYPDQISKLYGNEHNAEITRGVATIASMVAFESILKAPMFQMLFQSRAQGNGLLSALIFGIGILLGFCVAMLSAFTLKQEDKGLAFGFMSAMIFANTFLLPLCKIGVDDTIYQRESLESRLKIQAVNLISAGTFKIKKFIFGNTNTATQTPAIELA